jgi:arylformamidase
MEWQLSASRLSRRAMLGATAVLATGPALAEECRLGPAPHEKGARVFMDMDQQELDASYDQLAYEPLLSQITKRLASNSEAMRARIGAPERESYGPSAVEGLDIYRTKRENAPIFVFIHGGAWLGGAAKDYGYPAEMFVNAGAHYVAVDFIAIKEAGGDLGIMAKQVRSAVAWVHKNAAKFGGDPSQLYVGGHSSGGHLCGVVLVTDWQKEFGLPPNIIKGGLCMSGMYEMKPVALSARRNYVKFTDVMEDSMSAIRHIDQPMRRSP